MCGRAASSVGRAVEPVDVKPPDPRRATKIYVPLGGRQRNYSEFIEAGSLQVEFNMVRT